MQGQFCITDGPPLHRRRDRSNSLFVGDRRVDGTVFGGRGASKDRAGKKTNPDLPISVAVPKLRSDGRIDDTVGMPASRKSNIRDVKERMAGSEQGPAIRTGIPRTVGCGCSRGSFPCSQPSR
jgi:hypothetical protein